MNQREMKQLFRRSLSETPPEGAMERCLETLPDVKKEYSLFRLVRLQIRSLPRYIPGAAAAACFILAILGESGLGMEQMLLLAGGILAGIGLLLLSHMFLARSCEMTELEACCRYRFDRIVLSRCLCYGSLLSGFCTVVCIVMNVSGSLPALKMPAMLLPLTVSFAAALGFWLLPGTEHEAVICSVYLVASFLTVMESPSLAESSVWLTVMLLIVSVCAIIFEMGAIVIRSEWNGAFNM